MITKKDNYEEYDLFHYESEYWHYVYRIDISLPDGVYIEVDYSEGNLYLDKYDVLLMNEAKRHEEGAGKWMVDVALDRDHCISFFHEICRMINNMDIFYSAKMSLKDGQYNDKRKMLFYAQNAFEKYLILKALKTIRQSLEEKFYRVFNEKTSYGHRITTWNFRWKPDSATYQGVYGRSNEKDEDFIKKIKKCLPRNY